jgi:hypothetical protein
LFLPLSAQSNSFRQLQKWQKNERRASARDQTRTLARQQKKSDDDAVTAAALQRVLGSMKRGRGLRPGFMHVDLDKGP